MLKYILKRLLQSVLTVLIIVSVVFLLMRMMPTDYFFTEDGEASDDYVIEASPDMLERQLYAAYPPDDVMRRSSIMTCFNEEQTKAINQMWINVRCYNIKNVPVWGWIIAAAVFAGIIYLVVIRVKAMMKKKA